MKKYDPKKIEKKWQKEWEKNNSFKAEDFSKKPKSYILLEFPYASGSGLHIGHCRSYVGLDILSRKRRMEGQNVLFPMGWDSFGLPAENYSIKTGIDPSIATKKNTKYFKEQTKKLGLSFDWEREIDTSDPSYYKWTQKIFIDLFKNSLAYKEKTNINWCTSCNIGLANEEVVGGVCERCGGKVVKKEKEQWMLKITKYAERLIKDLDLVDYPERVKISQKEWIGKSDGFKINFSLSKSNISIPVFTTRIDTIFGATYIVLSPENPIIYEMKERIENFKFVESYIKKAKETQERERITKTKDGIELKGIKAINPANQKEIPIYVADYVLISYGTGAIMAVPAHDLRDLDFAKSHNLPIIEVIKNKEIKKKLSVSDGRLETAYEGEGTLINSSRFDGMDSENAKRKIGDFLEGKKIAERKICYKLRDWVFSRQRYWGEPIPMVNCKSCGFVPVKEEDLPVELPKIKKYKTEKDGGSPLIQAKEWIKTSCPICKSEAERETDVMPNWAGSNWYFLRYCDPKNDKEIADSKILSYWMPIDWYNGGMEHTTLHLLYSRFIYKFLWDIGRVPEEIGPEPYKKRTSHGMILGGGGIKMSKSKGNVINPDEVIENYGADALRIYEMFMGPFDQAIPWDEKGLKGARRFLEKVWRLTLCIKEEQTKSDIKAILHLTVKKVSEDIESLKFNTALSSLMEFTNIWQKEGINKEELKIFLRLLSPFSPHMTEELWSTSGFDGLCCDKDWPKYDKKAIMLEKTKIIIQVNGKVRGSIEVEPNLSKEEVEKIAFMEKNIKKWTDDEKIKKVIFVENKLINFVI